MSREVPPISPDQGFFDQFQITVSQPGSQPRPQPRNKRRPALRECIPTSEDEWQRARKQHRFATTDDLNAWVSNLISADGALPENLLRFINLAIFCVESRKDEDEAHRNYEARAHTKCTGRSLRNYASLVRGVIALMDQIYLKLRHRAFEAVLLYTPLNLSCLAYYKQEPEQFKSHFHKIKIIPEEHASQALYIPFMLACRYPEYKYNKICKALGTDTLNELEFCKFVSVRENRRPVPHILPTLNKSWPPAPSTKDRYDPIRNKWTRDNVDLIEHINTEEMFAIPDRLSGYKRFNLSEAIQQKSALAAEEQDGCVPQEVSGVVSFRFHWTTYHDAVCSLVLGSLVDLGFITPGEMHLSRTSVRHDAGPITVRPKWLKIIVPVIPAAEPAVMSLSSEGFYEDVIWDVKTGFLLGPGITLSPSRTLHYISVSIPTL